MCEVVNVDHLETEVFGSGNDFEERVFLHFNVLFSSLV